MDKCVGCNYYDRPNGKQSDSRGTQWGQCRRNSPMLHPINQKSYMIEGVWPHVRDDDWCGEWKALTRRVDVRQADSIAPGPLLPVASASPFSSRPTVKSPMQNATSFGTSQSGTALAASGRGD